MLQHFVKYIIVLRFLIYNFILKFIILVRLSLLSLKSEPVQGLTLPAVVCPGQLLVFQVSWPAALQVS